jgi:hypothetical protein
LAQKKLDQVIYSRANDYLLGAAALTLLLPFWMRLSLFCQGRLSKQSRFLVPGLAVAIILFVSRLAVINEDVYLSRIDICWHFENTLSAVNHVLHGKTILVDFTSQYGILYAYFAAWALAPFGLSMESLSICFAALWGLSLLFIYLALGRKMGYASPWSLLTLAALLGFWSPYFISCFFEKQTPIVYYQFYPLRVVCSAFFFWYTGFYFHHKTWWRMLFGYAAAGLSVLWNVDTGVIVLVAWAAVLAFDALAARGSSLRRRAAGAALYGVYALLSLSLSVAGYALFARIRSGQWPHLELISKYQQLYYGAGFFMLPMPLWEFWQPIILIYLITVFYCMRQLLRGHVDEKTPWYLFLALYGLGLFVYYQGRSHLWVLPTVTCPAVVLAGFWLSDLLPQCQSARLQQLLFQPEIRSSFLKLAGCAMVLFLGTINFCRFLPDAASYALGRNDPPPMVPMPKPEVESVRSLLSGTETLVLSPIGNYIYLKTNSYCGMPYACLSEVYLVSQVEELRKLLDHGPEKYVLLDEWALMSPHTYPVRHLLRNLQSGNFRVNRMIRPFGKGEGLVLLERVH